MFARWLNTNMKWSKRVKWWKSCAQTHQMLAGSESCRWSSFIFEPIKRSSMKDGLVFAVNVTGHWQWHRGWGTNKKKRRRVCAQNEGQKKNGADKNKCSDWEIQTASGAKQWIFPSESDYCFNIVSLRRINRKRVSWRLSPTDWTWNDNKKAKRMTGSIFCVFS